MLFTVQEPKKYARVRELLIKDEEIKNARKVTAALAAGDAQATAKF